VVVKDGRRRSHTALQNEQCWGKQVRLHFLWFPLAGGSWNIELTQENPKLISILERIDVLSVTFIKDFSDSWRPGVKFEARLSPRGDLDAVSQRLFTTLPSLHSCVVVEGEGFLWLNRLEDEPYVRCNWLDDSTASTRILPPFNICFDLDDTLIFNAPVKGCPVPLDFVVRDPPHVLLEDNDPNGEVASSDCPFLRPQITSFLELICPYFRNVRLATFSVEARAREIAEHLDRTCTTLRKNYRPDALTGQKPVSNAVFARELLIQQAHCLSAADRSLIKSGSVFWLKSLAMLDLPQKGLLQRTVVIDDRVDVWVRENQDNVVRISGPDRPGNIGDMRYINGGDGGEIGQRLLCALINLELKATASPAYRESIHNMPLPSPKRLNSVRLTQPIPLSPSPSQQIHSQRSPAGIISPPTKAPRSLTTGFSHAREKELREKEQKTMRGDLRQRKEQWSAAPTQTPTLTLMDPEWVAKHKRASPVPHIFQLA